MSDDAADELIASRVRAALRDVPDFPKPGIIFKDITPLLGDALLFANVVKHMAEPWREVGITHVAGIESRGFILGAPIALALGAGFIPIRKPGKLPYQTRSLAYALEYGSDRLEVHIDACPPSSRVLLVDDVLATGGTASTACELLDAAGEVAGCAFLLAIAGLHGKRRLQSRAVRALVEV
jgi:adenine phosphoribosyltransferase